LFVTVKKSGYTVSNSSRDTTIYYYSGSGGSGGGGSYEMVYVPGGSFEMGTASGGESNERPVHSVTLTQGFYIGKYEVTQAQYQAVMGTNPGSGYGVGDNYPVYNVRWYDAVVFCNKLSVMEGLTPAYSISGSTDPSTWGTVPTSYNSTWNAVTINSGSTGYRLPTEAQWEYAAKGGNGSPGNYTYAGSNTVGNVAWYDGNSGSSSHAVGTKAPNGLGIYDMSGNVWEWCWDWYGSYSSGSQTDPTGASSGTTRVYRGGSLLSSVEDTRAAFRYFWDPSDRRINLGFRLVRSSSGSDIPVTFSSVTADGSSTQTTTQLTLTFSQAINDLTANDISLNGVDGVSKGTLSGSGPTYTLPISGFTSGGTLSVSVEKSGYEISGSPKSTVIYYYSSSGGGGSYEMVYVPGGSFQMGTASGGDNDERPVHTVTLTGFYIGRTEVTQAQWYAVMGTTIQQLQTAADGGSTNLGRGDNYPVYYVSWYDALVFCNKLSMMEGLTPAYRISGSTDPASWGSVPTSSNSTWDAVTIDSGSTGYRLPTEAQWEYAAKGGNGSPGNYTYSGSNTVGDVAWYDGNSGSSSHVVGTKAPNGLGIYNMSGNVWEWCWDRYGDYSSSAQMDPTGASSGSFRMARGGYWGPSSESVRSADRYGLNPNSRYAGIGFRLARP
jgi:formylglycine-generating enzyme required for sulfatase activity